MPEYHGESPEARTQGGSTVVTIPSEVRHGLGLEPGEQPDIEYDPESRKVSFSFE